MSTWLDLVSVTWHVWVHLPVFVALTTRFERLFPLTLFTSLWKKNPDEEQKETPRVTAQWKHWNQTPSPQSDIEWTK